jgi:hypothetical protein
MDPDEKIQEGDSTDTPYFNIVPNKINVLPVQGGPVYWF